MVTKYLMSSCFKFVFSIYMSVCLSNFPLLCFSRWLPPPLHIGFSFFSICLSLPFYLSCIFPYACMSFFLNISHFPFYMLFSPPPFFFLALSRCLTVPFFILAILLSLSVCLSATHKHFYFVNIHNYINTHLHKYCGQLLTES